MKSRNLFVGILLLFIGVVALLSTIGVINFHWSIFWRLWPFWFILLGISLLPVNEYLRSGLLVLALGLGCLFYHIENRNYEGNVFQRFFKRHFTQWTWNDDHDEDDADDQTSSNTADFLAAQHFAEPYTAVEHASIDLDFGAGVLELKSPCAELAKVEAESNIVKYSFRTEHGSNSAAVYVTGTGRSKGLKEKTSNHIDLYLCDVPVWDFNLDMGAADATLDFSPYRVEEIDINGGACKLDLKVGDHGIDTKIDVETGASDINISVPSGVDCQITLDSAITGKDFKGFEKIERGLWRTPGFGQGANTITIDLECAVSNLSVERY